MKLNDLTAEKVARWCTTIGENYVVGLTLCSCARQSGFFRRTHRQNRQKVHLKYDENCDMVGVADPCGLGRPQLGANLNVSFSLPPEFPKGKHITLNH